jgi:hypothetical protein
MNVSRTAALAANMVMNDLKNSGGHGHTDKHTAILSPFVNGDAEIVAFDFHFWRQSPKTFSKAEIEAGRIEMGFWQQGKDGGKEYWDEEAEIFNDTVIDMSKVQTLFDNEVGFAFVSTAGLNYMTNGFVIFNAYQAGTHSLSVQGNSMAVNIPDTGIYVGFPTALVSNLPKKEELTEGDVVEMFRCEWEHVSAIDPKYLPGPVVIDLPIDKDTLFSGANIPVDDQMVETLEKAAINHSTVYVQITGGSTMVLPFNLAVVQSGQDYKYYTFCCVSVDMSTASYSGFVINLHTGDKTINGKATSIKGIFA